jgi:hypothetical protein
MNAMNRYHRLVGASILGLCISVACSGSTDSNPSGQGGSAGAQGGNSGMAGTPGKAGTNQQGAGTDTGGSPATPEGGSSSAGTGETPEGGSGGAAPSGPYQAVMGELCPIESTIGIVQLAGFPAPYVQVTLYDRPDPWIGAPELSTPTCAFHHYIPGVCQPCEAGEVCSLGSECVVDRRTIKDAVLTVSTGADDRQYAADAQLGGIYSTLDIGDATSSYAMTLGWGDILIELEAMPVAAGNVMNAAVTIEGTYDAPGALDATWDESATGAFIRSRIPINHHAGGPTFTECAAPESAGAFHADAGMIDPLAVVTGLEFQGIEHVFVAAVSTPQGCVEFRFGEQMFVFPN